MQRKTLMERVFHAVTFEAIATLICAPVGAYLMQRSVWEMGGLTIILATAAMIWNIIYNAIFDRIWPVSRVVRNVKVRIFHALGFECGFIVIGVNIAAFVLGISMLQAFLLELGIILFFLPYTMLSMAVQGLGWSVLPCALVDEFCHRNELVPLSVPGWPKSTSVDVVWSKSSPPGPAGSWIKDYLLGMPA